MGIGYPVTLIIAEYFFLVHCHFIHQLYGNIVFHIVCVCAYIYIYQLQFVLKTWINFTIIAVWQSKLLHSCVIGEIKLQLWL